MSLFCPSCDGKNIQIFYHLKGTPVHSCILMDSYENALSIKKREIKLGFCSQCGFVFNAAFDQNEIDYTQDYEDQQGFSPIFTDFMSGLSDKLIEKYSLYDKDIIEIGCGKGDFLSLLCEKGNNRGIGIDPAYQPGRIEANPKIRFIKAFYGEEHRRYPSDFICCRHTLEHIAETKKFLCTLRKVIKDDVNKYIFFEVPDFKRIVKEQAFWDIYYEHCSYFTAGSLARLFRSTGFEILELYYAYDDQYLMIEAKPVVEDSQRILPVEDSIEELADLIKIFTENIDKKRQEYRERLEKINASQKRVVIWGAGSKAVGFMTFMDDTSSVAAVIDINPHLNGHYLPGFGHQIVSPEKLTAIRPHMVVIMNPIYHGEIRKMLDSMKLNPEILALQ